jgi:hypothetical protein
MEEIKKGHLVINPEEDTKLIYKVLEIFENQECKIQTLYPDENGWIWTNDSIYLNSLVRLKI